MNQSRLLRLYADHDQVVAVFSRHPLITLVAQEGEPADKYTFEYRIRSLVPSSLATCQIGQTHRAQVFLPLDYPRRPPFCRMITPVFHPNIDPTKICIGDHWSAGQSLSQLVVRIGEMLCFQSYNVQSPLNAEAAAWVQQHLEQLPLERTDLSVGL